LRRFSLRLSISVGLAPVNYFLFSFVKLDLCLIRSLTLLLVLQDLSVLVFWDWSGGALDSYGVPFVLLFGCLFLFDVIFRIKISNWEIGSWDFRRFCFVGLFWLLRKRNKKKKSFRI